MKAYILTEADFEKLLLMIDRDAKHGRDGGSSDSRARNPIWDEAHDLAHGFYNYQVRTWIDQVQK